MTQAPVDVAFIGGSGRSGSTLLALMLGEIPGIVDVGELHHLWERGIVDNELCGCGRSFHDCAFWTAVGREAFGGWDEIDVPNMVALRYSIGRFRHWPLGLAPKLSPRFRRNAQEYAATAAEVCRAILTVSGGSIVLDSSKSPSLALVQRLMPGVRPRILHLVRDSRGVAYSWTKRARRPEATRPETAYMGTYKPLRSTVDWVGLNIPFSLLGAVGIPRLRVRYEDIVSRPRVHVERVLEFLGVTASDGSLCFLERDPVVLGRHHSVSGNPVRLRPSPLPIRLDDEWRTGLSRLERGLVLSTTWPLQLLYGYHGTREAWRNRPAPAVLAHELAAGDTWEVLSRLGLAA